MERSEKKSTAIRWQYFSLVLMIVIYAYGLGAVFELVDMIKNAGGDWSVLFSDRNADAVAYREYLMCSIFIILPFAVLTLLNRFCFGKVVCTADKDGLHLDGKVVEWSAINEAVYTPTVPSNYNFRFAAVELSIICNNDFPFGITILHFPIYGLRMIKKYAPNVKIRLSETGVFIMGMPIVITVVFILIVALGI